MPDFQAQPIISDRQSLRLEPYPQEGSASSIPSPIGTGKDAQGNSQLKSPAVQDAVDDGELTPDEVDELAIAADGGDFEAGALLKALGIGAGVAAGGAGAYLASRLMKNRGAMGSDIQADGSPKFVTAGTSEFDAMYPEEPGSYYRGNNYPLVPANDMQAAAANGITQPQRIGQTPQPALPAPNPQITDQRGGRFQQQGPQPQRLLVDQDREGLKRLNAQQTPPPRNPKAQPTGNSRVGQGLRRAARAARMVK
jgi:hypothetical protein